jgi:hypothetical protein
MKIRKMYVEADTYEDPSWAEIEAQIRSLNGPRRCDALFGDFDGEDQRYMAVSGGAGGRYLVAVEEGRVRGHYFLRDPGKGDESVMIHVGGLEDYYPAELMHDLATALEAAKTYAETRKRDRRFKWRKGPLE